MKTVRFKASFCVSAVFTMRTKDDMSVDALRSVEQENIRHHRLAYFARPVQEFKEECKVENIEFVED